MIPNFSIAGDFAAETGRATKPTIENVAKIKIGAVPVFIGFLLDGCWRH